MPMRGCWYTGDSPGEECCGEQARSTMTRLGCGAAISLSRSANRSTSTSWRSDWRKPGALDASPVVAIGGDVAGPCGPSWLLGLRRAPAADDSPLPLSIWRRVRGRFNFRSGFCSWGSDSSGEESTDFRLRRRLPVVLAGGAGVSSCCASCSRAFSNWFQARISSCDSGSRGVFGGSR